MSTTSVEFGTASPTRRGAAAKVLFALVVLAAVAGYGLYLYRTRATNDAPAGRPDPVLVKLAALESRMDRSATIEADLQRGLADLQRKLEILIQSASAIGADTSALRERAERAPTPQPAALPTKHVRRAAAPKPAQPQAPAPQVDASRVLGVDSWNGQPVVAVSSGGKIEFLRNGDVLGDAMLQSADAGKQRATFARHRKPGAAASERLAQPLNLEAAEVAP